MLGARAKLCIGQFNTFCWSQIDLHGGSGRSHAMLFPDFRDLLFILGGNHGFLDIHSSLVEIHADHMQSVAIDCMQEHALVVRNLLGNNGCLFYLKIAFLQLTSLPKRVGKLTLNSFIRLDKKCRNFCPVEYLKFVFCSRPDQGLLRQLRTGQPALPSSPAPPFLLFPQSPRSLLPLLLRPSPPSFFSSSQSNSFLPFTCSK